MYLLHSNFWVGHPSKFPCESYNSCELWDESDEVLRSIVLWIIHKKWHALSSSLCSVLITLKRLKILFEAPCLSEKTMIQERLNNLPNDTYLVSDNAYLNPDPKSLSLFCDWGAVMQRAHYGAVDVLTFLS